MRSLIFKGIDIEYRVSDDEYIITSIQCDEGLPFTIHMDTFYDAISDDLAEDEGEYLANRLNDRYDDI